MLTMMSLIMTLLSWLQVKICHKGVTNENYDVITILISFNSLIVL